MKKLAYILGPMTGYPGDNRQAFRDAAADLRKRGFAVCSPDELDQSDPAESPTWEKYLERDMPHLVKCEIGFALPGWKESRGAALEATVLTALGRPIFDYPFGEQRLQEHELPKPAFPAAPRAPSRKVG